MELDKVIPTPDPTDWSGVFDEIANNPYSGIPIPERYASPPREDTVDPEIDPLAGS